MFNTKTVSKLILLLLIALSASLPHLANTYAVGIGVNPSELSFNATSDSKISKTIWIINTGNVRTLYQLYFAAEYAKFFTFDANMFELNPNNNKQVKITYDPSKNQQKVNLQIELYIKGSTVEDTIIETGIKIPTTIQHTYTPSNQHNFPLSVSDSEIVNALQYLRNKQQSDGSIGGFSVSAWTTMAVASAGQDPNEWKKNENSIVDYLINNRNSLDEEKVTDISRFILAMTAANRNPRNINGFDYIAILENKIVNKQFGDESMYNDDFWAILALISAKVDAGSSHIQDSANFIKSHQNSDGGWSWTDGESDVDNTATAIMALIAAGENKQSTTILNGLQYLEDQLSETGGFSFMGDPNAASDSWGIMALVAANINPSDQEWVRDDVSPVDHLLSLQNPDGSFSWITGQEGSAWITSYTIPALLGKKYPITSTEMSEQVYVRIEDADETVWRGWIDIPDLVTIQSYNSGQTYQLEGNNILSILHRASELGGFNYQVSDQWYPDVGFYVESISDHKAQGLYGWLYLVNYAPGNAAMDKYIIQAADNVLIYWGTQGVRPLKIEADRIEVAINEAFTITVKYLNNTDGEWIPLEGATVHVNDDYVTDSEGKATITLTESKVYDIYAEKWGNTPEEQFIRSDLIKVGVGVPIPEFNTGIQFLIGIIVTLSLLLTRRGTNKIFG